MAELLGPRLRKIAELVPQNCACLADIGTDHGYLPAQLLRTGRVRRAIATDLKEGPLERARRTAGLYGVEMDFRLGSGLAVLSPGEAGVIVIAGMGGDTISGILSAAPWSRDGPLLLLQPMSRAETLRRWLAAGGWEIRAECLAEDRGVLYPILTAGGARPPRRLTDAEAWGGVRLADDPLWGRYLEKISLRLRRAAAGMEQAADAARRRRGEQLLRVSTELETQKGEWERAHSTGD